MLRYQAFVSAAIGTASVFALAIAAPATAEGRVTVPMLPILKRCDFSKAQNVPATGNGSAVAYISSDGKQVSADIQFYSGVPNTRYTARLIQVPRNTLTCSGADPGVTAVPLDTDGAGAATMTVRGPVAPGATGAWVIIDRPAEYSQTPAERYSSDFIAKF